MNRKPGETWPTPEEPSLRKIVAVALLDEQELRNVATGFKRIYPLADNGDFDDLLRAIDRAR